MYNCDLLLWDGERNAHVRIKVELRIVTVGAPDARAELSLEQIGHVGAVGSSMPHPRILCQIFFRPLHLQ